MGAEDTVDKLKPRTKGTKAKHTSNRESTNANSKQDPHEELYFRRLKYNSRREGPMTFTFLGPDPLEQQLEHLLQQLAAGLPPTEIETQQVDCKEEPDRRGPRGEVLAGGRENERAAKYLADELACFANTSGGGAIVVGVADDGLRIGTNLDPGWLRHRVYELTNRRLTIDVREVLLDEIRLLVLSTPEAIEPISNSNGRTTWRVDDHCVEVDPTTWHSGRLHRVGFDWSGLPSGHVTADASPAALQVARRFLDEAANSGDQHAANLAEATDHDLLRRLNLVADEDGTLTNAGSLLFVGTPDVGIDYLRRDRPGTDSTYRVRSSRALLEQLHEVDQAIRAANRTIHAGEGLAKGQLQAIPPRAAREAVVNGITHRDWFSSQPTTVEHLGDTLTVTSPGGLPGDVRADNIITHPSFPRYKTLAEALPSMRLAEREGIGVDRMIADMLSIGRPAPEIAELPGPSVRVALLGGDPDVEVLGLLAGLQPIGAVRDLDLILLITHLSDAMFVDTATAQPILQRPRGETHAALVRAMETTFNGAPLIVPIGGVPGGHEPAYRLSDVVRAQLHRRVSRLEASPVRAEIIVAWARHRGRVSSTEVADLFGLSKVQAGKILTNLANENLLMPGKQVKGGRGFFYRPAVID